MSRSFDLDELERKDEQSSGGSIQLDGLSRSGGNEPRTREQIEADEPAGFGDNQRERIVFRNREYKLRPSEDKVLQELITFRLIRDKDLTQGVYGRSTELAQADLRSLRKQGLVRSISFQREDGPTKVHTLTGDGYRLAEERSGRPAQYYYFGAVKRDEAEHDSLLYRAYLHESRRIKDSGGEIKRVILDTQLKREHYSRVNKPGINYRTTQAESARELHLPVIEGHVVFPDVRVEFEDERGELGRVDIEVATSNYRASQLETKAAAGFRVYASERGGAAVASGHQLKSHAFPQVTVFQL